MKPMMPVSPPMPMSIARATLAWVAMAWFATAPVWSQGSAANAGTVMGGRTTLVASFRAARITDPQYRAALSEKTVNDSAALGASLAYTPSLSFNNTQMDFEKATRQTTSITQPLLSADRFLTLREVEPRAQLAEATMEQREQDLAQRLLKAVTEIVRAREGIRVNEYRIALLDEQAQRARRMFQLNEGTVTDQRDTDVRRQQARATQLGLLTRLRVAENQFSAIVGARPSPEAFRVSALPRPIPLEELDRYLDSGQVTNPLLVGARQNERLAEIAGQRAKTSLLPTVSGVLQHSVSSGVTTNYVGIAVSLPLQVQSYAQIISAGAQAERAREQVRDTEQKLRVDIERLRQLVDSGQQELAIRKESILAGESAVEANLKSQQGGIRTTVDVMNAIQSLSDVRNEYTNTAATLAENYLSLLLQSAVNSADALEKVQLAVFEN